MHSCSVLCRTDWGPFSKQTQIRGLLKFKQGAATAVPLDEVEPAANIVKRFCTVRPTGRTARLSAPLSRNLWGVAAGCNELWKHQLRGTLDARCGDE